MAPLVAVLVGVGMLAVVPLGLRLVVGDDSRPRPPARWWTVAAVPAAVTLWLPRGPLAVLLCTGYLVAAVTLAVRAAGAAASGALGRADARREAPGTGVRRGGTWSVRLALLTALVSPLVAAGALLAERGGYRLLGFPLPVLALTVAHFHFAGFAAALVAALLCRRATGSRSARAAALCVPAGIGLVFLGFFVGDEVGFAGAVVLTSGMWLAAWATWREVRPSDPAARVLLRMSTAVLVPTMLLALDWAAGEAFGVPRLSLPWMAATHGTGNALGFGLCGILGWRLATAGPPDLAALRRLSYPEVGATATDRMPAGYHHLRYRSRIGRGGALFRAAGEAVLTWQMHRRSGVPVVATAPRAARGVRLACGLRAGPLQVWVPCEVVATVADGAHTGFTYGMLAGHPECGEESFVVNMDDDGTVWLAVTAFSRPVVWYTRLAGPLVPVLQRRYAARLATTLRRLPVG